MELLDQKKRTPLWRRSAPTESAPDRGSLFRSRGRGGDATPARHGFAFFGLCLFTFLLYTRPNDYLPHDLGTLELLLWSPYGLLPLAPHGLPIVKTVAVVTILAYVFSKLARGERLTDWPVELRALAVIIGLGILFMPIAVVPKDSYEELTDTFLKVAIIFVLMINLIDSLARLRILLRIVVLCGTAIAVGAVVAYAKGEFTAMSEGVGVRIEGVVEGIFGNPNDLATALNLLVPLAVALAILRKGAERWLYAAAAVVLTAGIIATFSRSGFLGFAAMAGFFLFKRAKQKPITTVLASVALAGLIVVAAPGGYADRLASIVDTGADDTGSASQRLALLKRAASVASRHLVLGVGMGNYHVYSISEMKAHNSFLEISAELGVAGLVAYLVMIGWPVYHLRRMERETRDEAREGDAHSREIHVLSLALQAAFLAYVVCSFFASIQYLWYLYYLVAYGVALRRIHGGAEAVDPGIARAAAKGVLWRTPRAKRRLAPAAS